MGFSIEDDLGAGPPLITMLKKQGKRILENADDIMLHLQRRFPAAAFRTLEGDAVATMSMREQVSQRVWPAQEVNCRLCDPSQAYLRRPRSPTIFNIGLHEVSAEKHASLTASAAHCRLFMYGTSTRLTVA